MVKLWRASYALCFKVNFTVERIRNFTVACMAVNSINVIFPEVEFITHSAFMTKNLVSKKLQTISILFNVTVAAICGEIVAS